MHLALLEQAIGGDSEGGGETAAILPYRTIVIAEVKTEVERVVRRGAHPALSGGERMPKAVPAENG